MSWKGAGITTAVIVACLIVLGRASSFVVDWAWFSSVGYTGVFWTVFGTKVVLFLAVFAASALLLWANGSIALRLSRPRQLRLPAAFDQTFATLQGMSAAQSGILGPVSALVPWRLLVLVAALVVALLVAWGEIGQWELILRFIHQVPYGQDDPQFGKDIGFYLFSLPM